MRVDPALPPNDGPDRAHETTTGNREPYPRKDALAIIVNRQRDDDHDPLWNILKK